MQCNAVTDLMCPKGLGMFQKQDPQLSIIDRRVITGCSAWHDAGAYALYENAMVIYE